MAEKGSACGGGSRVTWKVSDADRALVKKSSSFCIANLPDVWSPSSPSTAATKLRLLLKYLNAEHSRPVSQAEINSILSYSADVLSHCSTLVGIERKRSTGFEELEAVLDQQVKGWLSSTFTRAFPKGKPGNKQSFKSVATSVMFGRFMESLYKDQKDERAFLECLPAVQELFKTLDSWDFVIFEVETLTSQQPLRYIGHELFKRHDLLSTFKIPLATLDAFLVQVERGYKSHHNSYHNETHGADVLQTVHSLLVSTELTKSWLSNVELLAVLLAAIIHDVNHPGTTNAFQMNTESEYALLYNDRSVLENHHLTYAFRLLKKEETNILQGLSSEDYSQVRALVIDMVFATDMSSHFEHLNDMKSLLSSPDAVTELAEEHRSEALSLLLHSADVSNPAKPWEVHTQWTARVMEEFFKQGDREKELSLPVSPLCDRDTTNIPESQIGFIQHIVRPLWDVCGDMLEVLTSSEETGPLSSLSRPWLDHLTQNWERWTQKKAQT